MKILVQLLQGRSKSTPQNSTMDTGHSWDPEKKASDIKDPIVVADGMFVLHRWWKISRSQDTQFSEWISPLGCVILKKIIETQSTSMVSIATTKWCGPKSGEASQIRPESTRKGVTTNSIKTRRSQVIG